MALYLITGGAGFIGSNIVSELLKRNEKVRVLDNFSTGKRENLLPFNGQIELIEGSITDLETVRMAVKDVDYVLHQAALPSVPRSIEQPINSNEVNVSGTLNLLVACKDEQVKKVVIASSSSVYGNSEVMPKIETMLPMPLSPYAVSKLASEYYAKVFYKIYNLQTICLRYFNVFGPRQDPNSQYSAVIPKFIKALMNEKQPMIYGDGLQSRDFSFIENVVHANILAATTPNIGGISMNIACNQAYSLLDIVKVLNKQLQTDIQPQFLPERKGDVKHSLADISFAKKIIGYDVQVHWEEGLQRTVEWYKQYGNDKP
ncbi:MAG: SDR family oxidoreductase [Bacteroidetes bacterium]|nr:SDR family oxidoreductase [Bacteroidota bacterium]